MILFVRVGGCGKKKFETFSLPLGLLLHVTRMFCCLVSITAGDPSCPNGQRLQRVLVVRRRAGMRKRVCRDVHAYKERVITPLHFSIVAEIFQHEKRTNLKSVLEGERRPERRHFWIAASRTKESPPLYPRVTIHFCGDEAHLHHPIRSKLGAPAARPTLAPPLSALPPIHPPRS